VAPGEPQGVLVGAIAREDQVRVRIDESRVKRAPLRVDALVAPPARREHRPR